MSALYQSLTRTLSAVGLLCLVVVVPSGFFVSVGATESSAAVSSDDTTVLPEWLSVLNLTPLQIRQIVTIDSVLDQQMVAILTAGQYTQLQTFMNNNRSNQLSIQDADLDLSRYQKAALDVAFQEAMTSIVNILSQEQQQIFFHIFNNPVPEDSVLDI